MPRLSNAVILPTLVSSREFSRRIRRVLPERVFLWRLWTGTLDPNRNAASLLTGYLPGLSRLCPGSTRMTRESSSPELSQTSEVIPSWDSCILGMAHLPGPASWGLRQAPSFLMGEPWAQRGPSQSLCVVFLGSRLREVGVSLNLHRGLICVPR